MDFDLFLLRLILLHCRMWEFSVGLYMISVWPNSLLFAAIYGVVESASTAFFGPIVGDLVDKLAYVKVFSLFVTLKLHPSCLLL